MLITNVEGLRDPFILLDNGVYYLYGTGVEGGNWDDTVWDCYINDSGSLQGQWVKTKAPVYVRPDGAQKQLWAPEVYRYGGAYYMLASYFSSKTQHRGCSVLKAAAPTGPFVEVSSGHITPHDRDCIDGTLYIDPTGQPWLIFVHEWTCTEDRIGRMDAAMLSEDLTCLVSGPVELFRADSALWTKNRVTDGCFMHTLKDGSLLMLWSNTEKDGYSIGVVHSKTVEGPWEHEQLPLFKRGVLDCHDGGHGMIFTDTDGKMYICCHSPNKPCEVCKERTILIPVTEEKGTLCIAKEL